MQRCKAYEEHADKKRAALEKARAEHQQSKEHNLFEMQKAAVGRGLGETGSKLNVANVPFKIQIDCIGSSLQLQNFEFLYKQLY